MLAKDPKKRPTINQICKFPLVKKTLPKVLGWETFQDEFTHTVLHGRDVFVDEALKRFNEPAKKFLDLRFETKKAQIGGTINET